MLNKWLLLIFKSKLHLVWNSSSSLQKAEAGALWGPWFSDGDEFGLSQASSIKQGLGVILCCKAQMDKSSSWRQQLSWGRMQSGETKRQGGNGDVGEKGRRGSQQSRQDLPLQPYVLLDWKLQSCGLHPAHLIHSMEKTDRMMALPSVCATWLLPMCSFIGLLPALGKMTTGWDQQDACCLSGGKLSSCWLCSAAWWLRGRKTPCSC